MGKRHAKATGMSGVQLGMIITPMLDMAFQVLFFFVMNYHPAALEGHIDGNLLPPTLVATRGKTEKVEDFPAVDEQPPLEDAMLVVVKTVGKNPEEKGDGEPRRILLKRPEAPMPIPVVDEDLGLDRNYKVLREELEKIIKEPGQSKANIKNEGDGDLRHQYLMRAYDVCKQAGYQNISFVAPGREK